MRKVASLQSVVSCGSYPFLFISLLSLSLHSSLISIRTFNQNSIQFKHEEEEEEKQSDFGVFVSQVVSFLLLSSKFDGLASTSPGATWLRIHPVYIAADYLPTVSFYFCVSAK